MADAPKVNVGDRVRYLGCERLVVYRSGREFWTADTGESAVDPDIIRFDDDHLDDPDLELVEVAHYAPPGVPMIAMTPERIAALDKLLWIVNGDLTAEHDEEIQAAHDVFKDVLAEARKERAL